MQEIDWSTATTAEDAPGNPPCLTTSVLQHRLCAVLWTLTNVERQAKVLGRERDLAALGEVEHITLDGVHLVARLVGNIEVAVNDDLHLIVVVAVDERSTLLQAVEA